VSDPSPVFSDQLEASLARAFEILASAASDRRAAMHTPSVATIGLDGSPRSRTVVLRHFDGNDRSLRFHTDIRSEKFQELNRDPRISALFYDVGEKIQLRLNGQATLHVTDRIADDAWSASQAMSRHCYATEPAPGSVISEGVEFTVPKGRELTDAGRHHFCAVRMHFTRLEWLWLGSDGHRRALFDWNDAANAPKMRWLVP